MCLELLLLLPLQCCLSNLISPLQHHDHNLGSKSRLGGSCMPQSYQLPDGVQHKGTTATLRQSSARHTYYRPKLQSLACRYQVVTSNDTTCMVNGHHNIASTTVSAFQPQSWGSDKTLPSLQLCFGCLM